MIEAPAISQQPQTFRFSGHETFACRYAWLPKAYRAIAANPQIFFDEDAAMVELGIGKNMVRSLRFWIDAMGIAKPTGAREHALSDFGHAIFGTGGFDPYLEDPKTLWLLHWNLLSQASPPLFAWYHMIGQWPYPEFTRSEALASFAKQSAKMGHKHSEVTLGQHLDVFIHTYHSGKTGKVGIEDSLDGPLVDLRLLVPSGERKNDAGRWETVYSFRREQKPEITSVMFEHCVLDFWQRYAPAERTLTFRSVLSAPNSPGQVFKLPEEDVRVRLEELSRKKGSAFAYQPSAVQGLLTRREKSDVPAIAKIYREAASHA